MRYKSKVIAKHPDARLATLLYDDDGHPLYQRVITGPEWGSTIMDIHDGSGMQGATAAWRSAYFWTVRQARLADAACLAPKARKAGWVVAFCPCPACKAMYDAQLAPDPSRKGRSVKRVTIDEVFDNPTSWMNPKETTR